MRVKKREGTKEKKKKKRKSHTKLVLAADKLVGVRESASSESVSGSPENRRCPQHETGRVCGENTERERDRERQRDTQRERHRERERVSE